SNSMNYNPPTLSNSAISAVKRTDYILYGNQMELASRITRTRRDMKLVLSTVPTIRGLQCHCNGEIKMLLNKQSCINPTAKSSKIFQDRDKTGAQIRAIDVGAKEYNQGSKQPPNSGGSINIIEEGNRR
ncbi:hypothetical protein BB560_003792, partial [Smittium megazygosporum]